MSPTQRFFAVAGCAAGFLAVALGAFAAHGLRERLDPAMHAVFETAVRYQFYHALALLAVAWLAGVAGEGRARAAGGLFIAGIIVFSGSLYLLALTGIRWLGAITPVGGLCLLGGWVVLALTALGGRAR